jgi:hypothetical protein
MRRPSKNSFSIICMRSILSEISSDGDPQMIAFETAQKAHYYPLDRRFGIWIRLPFFIVAICLRLILVVAAWVQRAILGLRFLMPTCPKWEVACLLLVLC